MGAPALKKPDEKLVYTHVGYPAEVSQQVQSVHADKYGIIFIDSAGKRHRYLNCDLSTYKHQPPRTCPKCLHGYSELRMTINKECSECELDDLYEWSIWVQDWIGVDLGWRRHETGMGEGLLSRNDFRSMSVRKTTYIRGISIDGANNSNAE